MTQPNEGIRLDAPSAGTLPWPADAVIIVAARAGQENRAAMAGVVAAMCRRCAADLHADTRTVRTAQHLPERRGRPVEFFCVDCALLHRRGSLNLLVDQRGGKDDYIRTERA